MKNKKIIITGPPGSGKSTIIKALIDIGFVKIKNFNNSNKKLEYAYILTPKGIKEKVAITKKFLIKKEQEYDKLKKYISS